MLLVRSRGGAFLVEEIQNVPLRKIQPLVVLQVFFNSSRRVVKGRGRIERRPLRRGLGSEEDGQHRFRGGRKGDHAAIPWLGESLRAGRRSPRQGPPPGGR